MRLFMSDKSARYKQAVDALAALLEEEDLDTVSRAYAEAIWQEVSISTSSWWFPGRTLRVAYYRKERRVERSTVLEEA